MGAKIIQNLYKHLHFPIHEVLFFAFLIAWVPTEKGKTGTNGNPPQNLSSTDKIHLKTHDHHCSRRQFTTQALKTKSQATFCEVYLQNTEPHVHIKVHERSKQIIYPRESLKNIQYLLFRDRLICGLWVGFRCRSKDRVNVDIDKRKQLRVEGSGGFTELPIDPVLEKDMPLRDRFQSWQISLVCKYIPPLYPVTE